MPKLKSKSSLKKRVKITGTGKIMHMPEFSGCHHIREKKSPKRRRRFTKAVECSTADTKRIKRLLPTLFS